MTVAQVIGLVLGGGLVAAALTSVVSLWSEHQRRDAAVAAERRDAKRSRQRARRDRLSPLYAAAVRSVAEFAEVEHRKGYRLQDDDEEKLMQRLGEIQKEAQARLNEVGVPLLLETGAEPFNDRFNEFRKRYIRRLTAIYRPFPGLTSVSPDISIDLNEDVDALTAIAKKHLESLEAD